MGKLGTGKPQRSKQHKKLKDVNPVYVGERKNRNVSLIDRCPQNIQDQELPRKLKFIMDKTTELQNYKRKRHKKNAKMGQRNLEDVEPRQLERGMSRPMKATPQFMQYKNEGDEQFLKRMDRKTHQVILQSKPNYRYKAEFARKPEHSLTIKKKGMSDRKKERLKERNMKKKMKKVLKNEERQMESLFKDEVMFGDVVKMPPSITVKPRKAEFSEDVSRPGKRALLLKEIIDKKSDNENEISSKSVQGQSLKRKHLPTAERRILDAERQRAIYHYRNIKNKKIKTF